LENPPARRISFATWRAGGYANAAAPRRADPVTLQTLAGRSMGTTWSVRMDNPAMMPLPAVRANVEAALQRVIAQMSTWESESDISRFNRAAAGSQHAIESEFAEVLACAIHWASASGGAIDPTIGPLVALWGFGAHASASVAVPDQGEIATARARVGWQRLKVDEADRSILQPGGCALDLSGIAKGFAVDHVAAALHDTGLRDFLVEIGGELRAAGRRPGGEPWQVMIETMPGLTRRIALADMAIATSGDRWHVHDRVGRRWSHTIDPRSGEPLCNAIASVSVLHPQCMQADALATVLTVLGLDEGLAFARRHKIPALFVLREGAGHIERTSEWWPVGARAA
jgi:thiamine biosynthesis lipoprotein